MAVQLRERVRLDAISRAVDGALTEGADRSISGVSGLAEAGPEDLGYVASDRFIHAAVQSKAAAFVVARIIPELGRPQIVVPHPAYAFARIAQQFFVTPYRPRGIADQIARGRDVDIGPDVSIWPFVTLGDRVTVGARTTLYPGVFLGDDVTVGDDVVLYPNVTVDHGCRLGSRVIIHSGTVIGSDGFGYVQHEGRHPKIPTHRAVVIEDNVEFGDDGVAHPASY